MTKPRLVVAGNAVEDIYVLGDYKVNDYSVKFTSDGIIEEFEVNKGPIKDGGKYFVEYNLEDKVKRLWKRSVAGGGGINSIIALSSDQGVTTNFDLIYLDVSKGSKVIIETLKEKGISYHFFNKRDVSSNIVIERKDRILLVGPYLVGWVPTSNDIENVYSYIEGSSGFLMNSVKDPNFINIYLEAIQKLQVPLYAVLTPSPKLDYGYFKSMVLPHAVGIVNYKDLSKLLDKTNIDDNASMELAIEIMAKMHEQGLNKNFYVTLDDKGVYCMDTEGIYHVKLKEKYAVEVNDFIGSGIGKTKGLGDKFAAEIFLDGICTANKLIVSNYARQGFQFSIVHGLGYDAITPKSFDINTIKEFKK